MIKCADELRSLCRNKKEINVLKREILRAIEQKLINTNKDGQTSMLFEVPKQYPSIGNDLDSISQLIAGILEELVSGGYEVQIKADKHVYVFNIYWSAELTQCERQKISKLLNNHLVDSFNSDI